MLIFVSIVAIICIGLGVVWAILARQMRKIPTMTFEEMLAYTVQDREDARIAVAVIKDGKVDIAVYGNNAEILPDKGYEYEIGSITKTFTTSLLCRAISEGRISLDDSIDAYLSLPQKDYYPTLARLVTHTSGYKGYYFEWQMARNFLQGQKNDFYGIGTEQLLQKVAAKTLQDKDYAFQYSNFGLSVVGQVLSQVYGKDYTALMDQYIQADLGLSNTRISDGTGNLSGYWNWQPGDAYIPAGAILSTIDDMARYLQIHMTDTLPYLSQSHEAVATVNATSGQYAMMNLHIDAVGIGWILDTHNNLVWHNGGTSNFNSYAGFDKDRQVGIVILSNLPPTYKIPATAMGARLLLDLQK